MSRHPEPWTIETAQRRRRKKNECAIFCFIGCCSHSDRLEHHHNTRCRHEQGARSHKNLDDLSEGVKKKANNFWRIFVRFVRAPQSDLFDFVSRKRFASTSQPLFSCQLNSFSLSPFVHLQTDKFLINVIGSKNNETCKWNIIASNWYLATHFLLVLLLLLHHVCTRNAESVELCTRAIRSVFGVCVLLSG